MLHDCKTACLPAGGGENDFSRGVIQLGLSLPTGSQKPTHGRTAPQAVVPLKHDGAGAQEFRRESDCLAADIDMATPASLRGGTSPAARRRRVPLICEPGVSVLGSVQID